MSDEKNKPCPICNSSATEENTIFCLNANDTRVRCSNDSCLLRFPMFTRDDWNNDIMRGQANDS